MKKKTSFKTKYLKKERAPIPGNVLKNAIRNQHKDDDPNQPKRSYSDFSTIARKVAKINRGVASTSVGNASSNKEDLLRYFPRAEQFKISNLLSFIERRAGDKLTWNPKNMNLIINKKTIPGSNFADILSFLYDTGDRFETEDDDNLIPSIKAGVPGKMVGVPQGTLHFTRFMHANSGLPEKWRTIYKLDPGRFNMLIYYGASKGETLGEKRRLYDAMTERERKREQEIMEEKVKAKVMKENLLELQRTKPDDDFKTPPSKTPIPPAREIFDFDPVVDLTDQIMEASEESTPSPAKKVASADTPMPPTPPTVVKRTTMAQASSPDVPSLETQASPEGATEKPSVFQRVWNVLSPSQKPAPPKKEEEPPKRKNPQRKKKQNLKKQNLKRMKKRASHPQDWPAKKLHKKSRLWSKRKVWGERHILTCLIIWRGER